MLAVASSVFWVGRWPGKSHRAPLNRAEQCLAADCLQPTRLRRFGFRQQLKAGVRCRPTRISQLDMSSVYNLPHTHSSTYYSEVSYVLLRGVLRITPRCLMKSLLDGLPPEVAQRIHPDWQRNETEYWAVRDTLLPQYRDQWIAFANGRILVSGASAVEVLHTAQASGLHPFVICVGREHEPSRMRRAVFAYDTTYPHEALPIIPVEFRTQEATLGLVYEQVIPDTGADASALP